MKNNNNLHDVNYFLTDLIITLNVVLHKWTHRFFVKILPTTILACGEVSQWFRMNEYLRVNFQKGYYHIKRLGEYDELVQNEYALWTIKKMASFFADAIRFILAGDDTPIKRYGNKIQGCGWHFHPSNGNRDSDKFYGYPLVVLSLIIEHPVFGTVCIPLENRIYVSQKDLKKNPRGCSSRI